MLTMISLQLAKSLNSNNTLFQIIFSHLICHLLVYMISTQSHVLYIGLFVFTLRHFGIARGTRVGEQYFHRICVAFLSFL